MVSGFLDYVEIKTKITSLFVFFMILAYILYKDGQVNWLLTLIFFVSMFLFDLTTTAINNYIDSKNNGQALRFDRKTALAIIIVLLGASTASGLYLAIQTDVVVLAAGAICFFCGIVYTFGPVPISRQPLGELLSGVFYGVGIPFLMLYINLPKGTLVSLQLSLESLSVNINLLQAVTLAFLAVVPACCTADIMLANNICDVERDIKIKRFTLPYYLGRKSLYLFAGLYYAAYIDIILMVVLKILHPVCLVTLLTVYVTQKNIMAFYKIQDKSTTFIVSVKNYIVIMGTLTLTIFASILMRG